MAVSYMNGGLLQQCGHRELSTTSSECYLFMFRKHSVYFRRWSCSEHSGKQLGPEWFVSPCSWSVAVMQLLAFPFLSTWLLLPTVEQELLPSLSGVTTAIKGDPAAADNSTFVLWKWLVSRRSSGWAYRENQHLLKVNEQQDFALLSGMLVKSTYGTLLLIVEQPRSVPAGLLSDEHRLQHASGSMSRVLVGTWTWRKAAPGSVRGVTTAPHTAHLTLQAGRVETTSPVLYLSVWNNSQEKTWVPGKVNGLYWNITSTYFFTGPPGIVLRRGFDTPILY